MDEAALEKYTLHVDRDLPYAYAKKAQIDAPIHTDPGFANSIGLPDIILQGTCTLAKSVNSILTGLGWLSPGDIKRVSAKFTGMVVPPADLAVRILKKEVDRIHFDVVNEKGAGVIKGGQIILSKIKPKK
jgi:acyl dehydratase